MPRPRFDVLMVDDEADLVASTLDYLRAFGVHLLDPPLHQRAG